MNQQGGITNIIVAIIIVVFVLLALMTPINFLVEQAGNQVNVLQGTTRYARDPVTQETVVVDGGASLGGLTMTLLYGMGFIFLLGLVIYIILFGPNTQRPPVMPIQGGF